MEKVGGKKINTLYGKISISEVSEGLDFFITLLSELQQSSFFNGHVFIML